MLAPTLQYSPQLTLRMKKFRFPLRSVAALRRMRESERREIFAAAVRNYVEAEEALAHITERIAELEEVITQERSACFRPSDQVAFMQALMAERVRSLAQRSANAAKETAAKIEDSINKSRHGVHISAKVGHSLEQIVLRARKVDALVAEIVTAAGEQSQGIDRINIAVSQMDKVVLANASGAEETAGASEELSAQAQELKNLVGDLKSLISKESAA